MQPALNNQHKKAFRIIDIYNNNIKIPRICRWKTGHEEMVQTEIETAEMPNIQSTHEKKIVFERSRKCFSLLWNRIEFRVDIKFNRTFKHRTNSYSRNNFKEEIESISNYVRFLSVKHIGRKISRFHLLYSITVYISFIRFLAWSDWRAQSHIFIHIQIYWLQ